MFCTKRQWRNLLFCCHYTSTSNNTVVKAIKINLYHPIALPQAKLTTFQRSSARNDVGHKKNFLIQISQSVIYVVKIIQCPNVQLKTVYLILKKSNQPVLNVVPETPKSFLKQTFRGYGLILNTVIVNTEKTGTTKDDLTWLFYATPGVFVDLK